ncbi:MAG: hypothetical protein AMXMBFR80_13300 [Dehalococcoidia bacterium]
MPFYDRPFFKQLPKNDLGIATHQGGVVIPKGLVAYLPPLPPPSDGPTEEYPLVLDLFDGGTPVGTVTSRWHYQTWGKTRPPEHRLTKNIESALLAGAAVGDILVFERQLGTVDRFRVTLVRQGSSVHSKLLQAAAGKRWGVVGEEAPESLAPILDEMEEILEQSSGPFKMFEERRIGNEHRRLLRDAGFSRLVKRAYAHSCSACGVGWLVPIGEPGLDPVSEPEAAHIVPVALRGRDDLRNALCLCRAHHWAFDRKLLFVDESRTWRVIPASQGENRNALLNDIEGSPLRLPLTGYAAPAAEALAWHRERVLSA